jgi:uncharacterized protein (TIGR03067 family)
MKYARLAAIPVLIAITAGIVAYLLLGRPATVESERAKLEGRWELVQWERRGVQGPPRMDSQYEFFGDGTFQITTAEGRVRSKRKYDLHVDANPRQMDWFTTFHMADKTVREMTVKAIYSVEGDRLTICKAMALSGPRPTVFDSKPENDVFIFKRLRLSDAEAEQKRKLAIADTVRSTAWLNLRPMASKGIHGRPIVDFHESSWTRVVTEKHWQDLLSLRDIRELRLRGCTGVGNNEMEHVAKLATLESLDLHSTEVGDAGIARLTGLKNLECLDLSFTSVSDGGLVAVARIARLKKVVLQGTLVTKKGVADLRAARKDLEIVWPRSYTESQQKAAALLSRLGMEIDDGIDPHVQPRVPTCLIVVPPYINIGNTSGDNDKGAKPGRHSSYVANNLDASVVARCLEKLPAPTSVNAATARMDDSIFSCIRDIHGLVRLDLRSTHITDGGLAELERHKALRVLNLSSCKRVTGKGIASLAALINLETLDLSGLRLTPDNLRPLLKLDHLKVLALDHSAVDYDLNWELRQKGVELRLRYVPTRIE